MKDSNLQEKVNKLTHSQKDMLNSLLAATAKAVTSKEIAKNLKIGGSHSISAMSSIATGPNPLVLNLGKKNAREGVLWMFNEQLYDRKEAEKLMKEIVSEWVKLGIVAPESN